MIDLYFSSTIEIKIQVRYYLKNNQVLSFNEEFMFIFDLTMAFIFGSS